MIRVFASHNWGTNGDTHRRVEKVVRGLRTKGIQVWFDQDDLKGNILSAMCSGMDASHVVLVFVTKAYIEKVQSGKETDNVRREFMYAAQTPEKLVPILFEPLSLPWSGPVAMVLGTHLYHDMSVTSPIRTWTNSSRSSKKKWKNLWKHAVAKTGHKRDPEINTRPTIKERIEKSSNSTDLWMDSTRNKINNVFKSIFGDKVSHDLNLMEKLKRWKHNSSFEKNFILCTPCRRFPGTPPFSR